MQTSLAENFRDGMDDIVLSEIKKKAVKQSVSSRLVTVSRQTVTVRFFQVFELETSFAEKFGKEW